MENTIKPGDVVELKTLSPTRNKVVVSEIQEDHAVCHYFDNVKNEYIKVLLPLIILVISK